MSTCPYCGAETRPGDNFCLNCGNRLVPSNSSPQQAQPVIGDSTLPAEENNWSPNVQGDSQSPSGSNWADLTVANTNAEQPTLRADSAPTMQATMDRIEQPAKFILRSENGDVIQEYPLDKYEITIGRAPTSDILLSKDKLTSRRHATVRYEDNNYVLRDERSANGTFVNGQQLEEMVPRILHDGDHVGIGEHELIFRSYGSNGTENDVEDMPTVSVQQEQAPQELTYRTREDELATLTANDEFNTKSMEEGTALASQPASYQQPSYQSAYTDTPLPAQAEEPPYTPPVVPTPVSPTPPPSPIPVSPMPSAPSPVTSAPLSSESSVTFGRLTSVPQPSLPDIAPLTAALATLDGQVTALQEQLNATQEAMRNHDSEIVQVASQLRAGVRRVSERMDSTIADVARRREELAWADLLQLMEDVQNNPRDIEYVTKLARKARELNKVFQIHQNVLNTLAECNSLLRGLIGEDR